MMYQEELSSNLRSLRSLPKRMHLGRLTAIAVAGIVLLALLALSLYIDGRGTLPLDGEVWWRSLQLPVLITYILLVGEFLDHYGNKVIAAFRPLVEIDDEAFGRLVANASGRRHSELLVVGAGVLTGILLSRAWVWQAENFWLQVYVRATVLLLYGLLGSAIYQSLASNRLFSRLYHEPLKLNIFDLTPLRPVAQQGLAVALAFVGGVTISVFFSAYPHWLLSVESALIYGTSIVLAIVLFFGSLLGAHQVMVHAKEQELKVVRSYLSTAYQELKESPKNRHLPNMSRLVDSVSVWLAYEKRIKEAPEWPYTADTLRSLLVSILLPIVAAIIAEILTN